MCRSQPTHSTAPIQQHKEISCTYRIKDRRDCCRLPLHSKRKTQGPLRPLISLELKHRNRIPLSLLHKAQLVIFQQQTVNALLKYFDSVTVGCTIRQFLVKEKLDLLSNLSELHSCSGAVQQQSEFFYHKRTFLFGPVCLLPYGSFLLNGQT